VNVVQHQHPNLQFEFAFQIPISNPIPVISTALIAWRRLCYFIQNPNLKIEIDEKETQQKLQLLQMTLR
jgi:hypothetical protein